MKNKEKIFKIGDSVKVVRLPNNKDYYGLWGDELYREHIKKNVGKIFKILDCRINDFVYYKTHGNFYLLNDFNGRYGRTHNNYPGFILKLVQKAKESKWKKHWKNE